MFDLGSGKFVEADRTRSAFLEILRWLQSVGYTFVTSTPASHARVVGRPDRRAARNLRDVLGWSLPFESDILDPALLTLMHRAGIVDAGPDGRLRCTARVSDVEGALFFHSAFPTDAQGRAGALREGAPCLSISLQPSKPPSC